MPATYPAALLFLCSARTYCTKLVLGITKRQIVTSFKGLEVYLPMYPLPWHYGQIWSASRSGRYTTLNRRLTWLKRVIRRKKFYPCRELNPGHSSSSQSLHQLSSHGYYFWWCDRADSHICLFVCLHLTGLYWLAADARERSLKNQVYATCLRASTQHAFRHHKGWQGVISSIQYNVWQI